MEEENIKIIFVAKDDNLRNAKAIQKETNATIYELNSGLTGSLELESYIKMLDENLNVFKTIK